MWQQEWTGARIQAGQQPPALFPTISTCPRRSVENMREINESWIWEVALYMLPGCQGQACHGRETSED